MTHSLKWEFPRTKSNLAKILVKPSDEIAREQYQAPTRPSDLATLF
jgi:hypothetical protein